MSAESTSESKLLRLANALTRSGHDDFFPSLVNELTAILDMDYALIAEIPANSHQVNTLAVSARGEVIPNFTYHLSGTPCETVPERELCEYSQGVSMQFPDDQMLQDMSVQSYFGMPILTSDGDKLGILSTMSQRPVSLGDADKEILRIAAAQVGSELELSNQQRHIHLLTYEDAVTGLPNRQRLLDLLNKNDSVRNLYLIDIQRFKDINDLHGHIVGDAILYAVAERLKSRIRGRGQVARLSGDEFVVVPSAGWQTSAEKQVSEIQSWFEQPFKSGKNSFHLRICIGMASAEEISAANFNLSGTELLRRSGVSLAEAKSMNVPFMAFDPAMVDSRQYREKLYERLQAALRNGYLSLHFQPQIHLETGKLFGAEVLCRWHDPDLGWVSPSEFIPLAEERGLMTELGNWVLEASCQQLSEWAAADCRAVGKMSVNISALQLDDARFAENTLAILSKNQSSDVVLELTESAMMRSPEVSLRQLSSLADEGFSWAIDDFGTGYSSLAFLTRMSAGYLKIDRSFVSRVPGSKHDESVIRTIVAMARAMDMEIIAEGIETDAQRTYLHEIGCRYGQGYAIGHPVDAVEFSQRWLGKPL